MKRLASFVGSLRGQIILLLTIGMSAAASLALVVAQRAQAHWFERAQLQSVVVSARDIAHRLASDPAYTLRMLRSEEVFGARLPPAPPRHPRPDPLLTAMLRERLGDASGWSVTSDECFVGSRFSWRLQAAGIQQAPKADCWLVRYADARGATRDILIWLPRFQIPAHGLLDPLYLLLVIAASAALGILAAQIAAVPLRRLTQAAHSMSATTDLAPITEQGPVEVRTAIATFNLMQGRLIRGVRERTQILAAISHDLQTPLTRLRLRLEQVSDEVLRERLVTDLAATQRLVREGLDLARSSESREEWQVVDIDSLLASLAEDAAEFGADVQYLSSCGGNARTKPDALIRCLTNLIDNAVKYGGGAELECARTGAALEIRIRDHGPGLPPDVIESMFEPFTRFETSRSRQTGGTGIGLTIARAQARLFDATISLVNHPQGGLLATVRL